MGYITYWTDDREQRLRKLFAENYSASQIADRLGGTTRNAVIGKLNRLGLFGKGRNRKQDSIIAHAVMRKVKRQRVDRGNSGRSLQRQLQEAEHAAKKAEAQAELERLRQLPDIPALVAFVDLESHHCRWIPGDIDGLKTMCCGRPQLPGLSYCQQHAARALNAIQPKGVGKFAPSIGTGMLDAAAEFTAA